MRFLIGFFGTALFCCGQGTVFLVAGGGGALTDNVPAIQSRLGGPRGMVRDGAGNFYLSEMRTNPDGVPSSLIRRIDAVTGLISTVVASNSLVQASEGAFGQVNFEAGQLALAPDGSLFVLSGFCLKRIDPAGKTIAHITGICENTFGSLASPAGLAVDAQGKVYVTTSSPSRILRVDPFTKTVTRIAGSDQAGFSGDGGPALDARLSRPSGLVFDAQGNLFVADTSNNRVRRIDALTSIITTVAGNGQESSTGDGGLATLAALRLPAMVTVNATGDLFIGETGRIRRVVQGTGNIVAFAGKGAQDFLYNGEGIPALNAGITGTGQASADAAGNLWIADDANTRLRFIAAPTGLITTIAGVVGNGDGGPATLATFDAAKDIAMDASRNILVAETARIRRIDRLTGVITTVAGGGADAADGALALDAKIAPVKLAVAPNGEILFAEENKVRKIDVSGRLATVAGTGAVAPTAGAPVGDGGPAVQALLRAPGGLSLDVAGNLLIADTGHCRVRRVDRTTAIITTIIGTGLCATAFPQGVATQLDVEPPSAVLGGPDGEIYAAVGRYVIRLQPDGQVQRLAGNGQLGNSAGDGGSALLAPVSSTFDLDLDRDGNLLLSNLQVRRIDKTTGIIQTIAGGGLVQPTNGASAIAVSLPGSIVVDGDTLFALSALPQQISFGGRTEANLFRVTPLSTPPMSQPPNSLAVWDSAGLNFQNRMHPGQLISVTGHYLGPVEPAILELDGQGNVAKELRGVRVFFDGVPAPVLYVSAAQINVVVPYAWTGKPAATDGFVTATVEVQTPFGRTSVTRDFSTIFGPQILPGTILNEDWTRNSAERPASPGGIVILFVGDIGPLSPPVPDGTVIGLPLPVPVDSLTARVTTGNYGKPASVLYGGPVPTLVAGVGQINLRLPADVPGGTDSVSIISGTRPGNGSAIYIALGTPVVRSLSTVPKANTTETVTFSGDGFDGNAVLNLYRDGQFVSAPPNAGTNALTRTSLTKRVTWGAAGRWEVEVVNPSGRKSPRFAFDVVE